MKRWQIILLVIGATIVITILGTYSFIKNTYNELVVLDEGVKTAWAQVQNQLQRRYDLIPNYVETVKGYASHEKEVLTAVTEARARVGQAQVQSPAEQIGANNALSGALARLLVVVENYPQLKANENFIRLQDELAGTENRISVERRRYNETAQAFNQRSRTFPTNLIASFFGFQRAQLFEAGQEAQSAPRVQFTK